MDRLATWVAVVVGTLLLAWLQLSFDGLFDLDSYFHVRAALELAENGVEKQLPQAAFSTWAEAYSDKDLLFHAFLIPFVSEEAFATGGKWAVVTLDFLVLASLALVMQASRVRFGAFWILLLVAASPYYVLRLIPLRPHLLGMAFVSLEILLLLGNRWKSLFVVAVLHVWAHSSFPLVGALLFAWIVVNLVRGERFPTAVTLAVVAGLAIGSLAHPYFPNNLLMTSQIFEVVQNAWTGGAGGIPPQAAGSELKPMLLAQFLKQSPVWVPALLGVVALVWVRGVRGWSARDLFFLFVACGFLVMAWASRRFLGEFMLGAVLFAAAAWTSVAAGRTLGEIAAAPRSALALVLLVGCFGYAAWRVSVEVPERLAAQSTAEIFRPDVERLDELAGPADVVYHPSWMDFSYLYAFRPHGRYIAGLDPVFLFDWNPKVWKRSFDLSRGVVKKPKRVLVGDFGARFVFVTKQPRYLAFRRVLARTPGIERVHEGRAAEIWEVAPAP